MKSLLFILLCFTTSLLWSQNDTVSIIDSNLYQIKIRSNNKLINTLNLNGLNEVNLSKNHAGKTENMVIKGLISNGRLDKNWRFQKADLMSKPDLDFKLIPTLSYNGIIVSRDYTFAKGLLNGKYSFTKDSFDGKNIHKQIELKADVFENKTNGKVFYENKLKNFKINGQCQADGLADGLWIIEFFNKDNLKEKSLEILFWKGILISETSIVNKQKNTIKHVDDLGFLELQSGRNNSLLRPSQETYTDVSISEFPDFVLFLDCFKKMELPAFQTLKALEFGHATPQFKKVTYHFNFKDSFCFDSILSWQSHHQNDTQLMAMFKYKNLINASDLNSEIQFDEYEKLLKVYDLAQNLKLLSLDDSFSFRLKNETIWIELLSGIQHLDAIHIQDSVPSLQLIIDAIPKIDSLKNSKHHKLVTFLERLVQHEELLQLESSLKLRYDAISQIYEKRNGIARFVYDTIIQVYLKTQIAQHLIRNDFQQTKNNADVIFGQIDLLELYDIYWRSFDSMSFFINEVYTYFEYNPYNGKRDIEMKKKKRFLLHIQQFYYPWVHQQSRTFKNWKDWASFTYKCRLAQEFLINFATDESKDAKHFDKRARKEFDGEKLLQMFYKQFNKD